MLMNTTKLTTLTFRYANTKVQSLVTSEYIPSKHIYLTSAPYKIDTLSFAIYFNKNFKIYTNAKKLSYIL